MKIFFSFYAQSNYPEKLIKGKKNWSIKLQKIIFECFQSKDEKTYYAQKYEKADLQHLLSMPEKK